MKWNLWRAKENLVRLFAFMYEQQREAQRVPCLSGLWLASG
jgi:hypothetical protein